MDTTELLTKERLLAATAVPEERVIIPELGCTAIVRGLTGDQRDDFEAGLVQGRGRRRDVNMKNLRGKLVARTVVDESGQRLFTDAEAVQLGTVRADVLNRLFTAAQRLSGLSQEDVDELGKPSESDPS